jgi:cytochrome c oxidase subunit 4
MSEPTKNFAHQADAEVENNIPRDLVLTVVLICGTLLSVGSSYIPLGPANGAIVLVIALFQAFLTLWYFMEVRDSSRVMKLAIVAGIFTLGVLFLMTMCDYVSRAWGSW